MLISSAVGAFATFRMLPVVISSLVKPVGVPVRVTPKGSGDQESEFDADTFLSIAVTALGFTVGFLQRPAGKRRRSGGRFEHPGERYRPGNGVPAE